jgi:hypothetical protein
MKRVILLLVMSLSTSFVFAQAVADAAKTKPAKKASRVITNDDIPSKAETNEKPASATPSGTASLVADEKPASNPEADEPSPDKAPGEVQDLEKQLSYLNKNIAARQKRTDEYRDKMKNETDDHRKEIEQEVLTAMEGDVESMQKESQDLQKKIDEKKQAVKDKPKETAEPKESTN